MPDPSPETTPPARPAHRPTPSEAAELELGTLEVTLPPLPAKRADTPQPIEPHQPTAGTEQGEMS